MRALFIRLLGLLATALLLMLPRIAFGHARSVSYSTWIIHENGRSADVRARLSRLDVSLLERAGNHPNDGTLGRHIAQKLRLVTGTGPCAVSGAPMVLSLEPDQWVDVSWQVACPQGGALAVESDLLVDANPSHVHFVRTSWESSAVPSTEVVLDAAQRRAIISSPGQGASDRSFWRFVSLGAGHIATGWDHLLFVALLVLGARARKRAILAVTGFTVGHSVTLSLAALGIAAVHEAPVEAMIGLSIALLAVENAWMSERHQRSLLPKVAVAGVLGVAVTAWALGRAGALAYAGAALFAACSFALLRRSKDGEGWRALAALLFGLVHGLGFARGLTGLDLPKKDLMFALFGFNLGVELGQLTFVVLLLPVAGRVFCGASRRSIFVVVHAAAIGLGVYWLVHRAFV